MLFVPGVFTSFNREWEESCKVPTVMKKPNFTPVTAPVNLSNSPPFPSCVLVLASANRSWSSFFEERVKKKLACFLFSAQLDSKHGSDFWISLPEMVTFDVRRTVSLFGSKRSHCTSSFNVTANIFVCFYVVSACFPHSDIIYLQDIIVLTTRFCTVLHCTVYLKVPSGVFSKQTSSVYIQLSSLKLIVYI